MKVIFTGDPIEIERAEGLSRMSTSIYGVHFPMSAEVDISHLTEKQQMKLMHNPHFRVAGVDGPAVPLILPAAVKAAEAEPAAESVEEAPPPSPRRRGAQA